MAKIARTPERFTPKTQRARDLLRQLGLATDPLHLLQSLLGASLMHGLVDAGLPGYLALIAAIAIVLAGAFTLAMLAEPAVRSLPRTGLSARGREVGKIRRLSFLFRPSDTI